MYALEGADVAIVYLPEEQVDAEKTKAMIERAGRQCLLFPQDIRDEAGCKRIIDSVVQAWGRIDVLVNNASVVCASPYSSAPLQADTAQQYSSAELKDQMYSIPDIADVTTEQFDRTIKTNIYGTFWMTKFAVPHIPKGGSIIVTASQVRFRGPCRVAVFVL